MAKRNRQPRVAYFSMEYAVENSFKTYAGGLGILAGDYLKGAKDHGFPIVGIGIKWKQGYSDQILDDNGKPYDTYHNYDYDFLTDTKVEVSVKIRNVNIRCKVWKLDKFGTVPLYLLDTDIPGNPDPWITGQLYGWFGEERIAQEMVLGIGGVRALRALGIDVDIYHFNEGHALFAGFELIREKMTVGASFEEAWQDSKEEIVFTTHTPVVQGNETHPIFRIKYMGADLGLTKEQLRRLGGAPFNMTVGGLRLAKKSNAVAQLHGVTANQMWKHIKKRSEIIAITNAIHLPTWVDKAIIRAAETNKSLKTPHLKNKRKLIDFVQKRTGTKLREDRLVLGFSRRAVPYKRSDLIFTKTSVIEPLLKNQKVQLIFSGKAHPMDDTGKGIVANLVKMTKKYPKSVVFLQNYDMEIGAMLTRGSDVWLNNPRRPMEASGTSGMKASMNGVLNFSIMDGWWDEACEHGVNGWQFGNSKEFKSEKKQDAHDLKGLYDVLLKEVIPIYYEHADQWEEMMRSSIISTKDQFAMKRMLEEYYEHLYTA